jgi:flagellar motility protein MotE (MotC chaperone)
LHISKNGNLTDEFEHRMRFQQEQIEKCIEDYIKKHKEINQLEREIKDKKEMKTWYLLRLKFTNTICSNSIRIYIKTILYMRS